MQLIFNLLMRFIIINQFFNLIKGKIDDAIVNIHNINEYIASIISHLLKINDFKSIDRFY